MPPFSRLALGVAALGLTCAPAALASETIAYTYDARGRLVQVLHSGTVNDGVHTTYTYDKPGNRTNVTSIGGVLYRSSFEGALPALFHPSDGGWVYLSSTASSPYHGSSALRLGMVGSHAFALTEASFVAGQSTVTVSAWIRDSGVSNISLTNWSGSSADSAHGIILGLYNATAGTWTWSSSTLPPNGGAWVRSTQTISGLSIGATYMVSLWVQAYDGARASDIDALQVEHGNVATPFGP
jgi:YD repeat-containing protein